MASKPININWIRTGSPPFYTDVFIASFLQTKFLESFIYCRETMVDIRESVRGKDVYLLQTAAENVNDVVM